MSLYYRIVDARRRRKISRQLRAVRDNAHIAWAHGLLIDDNQGRLS